ncbi:MAG TPA: hypothetical protein VGP61_06675, partial [Gemmatimonadales bacterium]|nr:hypothetical protein [Gemmatimonadales bacterium]
MNLDKLKEAARKFEQREEWRRAIDVYLQAIHEAEEAGEEGTQDPGLYNRVGDLQLKAGDSLAALRAYEEAAQLYADQGFFNNAIALCGKILRVNPSRTGTYLRLAQLHARKNFVGEAKKNLVEYLERMNGVGQLEEAFTALKLFADQFSANPDIRLMLVELLRASSRNEDAKEQLEKLALELEARGDTTAARRTRERLQAIEGGAGSAAGSNELIFLDTGLAPELTPGSNVFPPATGEPPKRVGRSGGAVLPAPAPDDTLLFDAAALESDGLALDDPTLELLEESREAIPLPSKPAHARADPALLQLTDALAAADFAAGVEPTGNLRHRAHRLLAAGDGAGGLRALEEALRTLEAESQWNEALLVAADLVRLEPSVIYRYQKQVELAYFAGERRVLIAAYVELADALMRAGATHQAAQVYRRVLEHDQANAAARAALALIAPAAVNAAPK